MSKKKVLIVIGVVIWIIAGLGIMFYPVISNWYQEAHHGEVIRTYQENVLEMTDSEMDEAMAAAQKYNDQLVQLVGQTDPFSPEFKVQEEYDSLLNVNDDGVMSYIEIPKINVYLPVYHGTSDDVLAKGVGHIDSTSLPIGGTSTHSVLSAHRGDPSATLFTNLDQIVVGDRFYLYTLDEKLGYEVDQIKVVSPYDIEDFRIVSGKDYVTLVTCTPYGINSHRLLVRGKRVVIDKNEEEKVAQGTIAKTATNYWPYFISLDVLLLLIIGFFVAIKKRRKHEEG